MKRLIQRFNSFLNTVKSKIAFYPTIFAITGFISSFLMIFLENRGISKYLLETLPSLVVNNGDTALTILSACITGLISMMVFSFSMVMLILNQASSNYSPRLLPGLISEKNHQIILGIYLGTILYCIFIAISIQPEGDKYQVPGFSVLLGILGTVFSLCAFIYFIHSISQNIQINNILDGIYKKAYNRLTTLVQQRSDKEVFIDNTDDWYSYHTNQTGYFQNIAEKNIIDICEEKGTRIKILPAKGMFILKGVPIFRSEKELEEEEIKEILSNFNFAKGELVEDNYNLAFKQITEVLVKAMSPGINDPGTALNAIDYLTELFAIRMKLGDEHSISRNEKAYIFLTSVSFKKLFYNVMASIRAYCKHDIVIVQKLAIMIYYLKNQPAKNEAYYKVLDKEAENLLEDARGATGNNTDQEVILGLSRKLNLDL